LSLLRLFPYFFGSAEISNGTKHAKTLSPCVCLQLFPLPCSFADAAAVFVQAVNVSEKKRQEVRSSGFFSASTDFLQFSWLVFGSLANGFYGQLSKPTFHGLNSV